MLIASITVVCVVATGCSQPAGPTTVVVYPEWIVTQVIGGTASGMPTVATRCNSICVDIVVAQTVVGGINNAVDLAIARHFEDVV